MELKNMLRKFDIRPVKSLGQNFLADTDVIRHITDEAGVGKEDTILEIGPGTGAMTTELAARAGRVIAVEIDRHLIPVLKANLEGFTNVQILNSDIMKIDIGSAIEEASGKEGCAKGLCPLKVISNLPYYITTPVIMKLLESDLKAELMLFMVQKEVADRITAEPGGKNYGALSVAVRFYSLPSRIFDVPPSSFIPQPDVFSTVVRLDIFKKPPVDVKDKEIFFKVVKASFGQRRKTLVNALYNSGYFNIKKDEIREMLVNQGIDENCRGETLTIMQFAKLSNSLFNNNY